MSDFPGDLSSGSPLAQFNRLEALKLALDTIVPDSPDNGIATANKVLTVAQRYLDFIEHGMAGGGEIATGTKPPQRRNGRSGLNRRISNG